MTEERSLLEGNHSVLTPEYVEFDFVLAGLFSRFLAWFIDTLVTLALAFALMVVMSFAMIAFPGFASALAIVIWFLIDWGYAIFFESVWSGQTLGKRAMGLRVIQESGVRIGFLHAVLRNLARPIDRLPFLYAVGGTAALFSQSQQRLGDMLAGTIVVRDRRLKIPSSIARPDGETALLEDPLFRSRIAKLSAEEEALIFSAALRREEMGMEARLSLFAALSQRMQDDADVYKPPHLSDEKLVLLCAAALAKRNSERSMGASRKGRPRNMLQQRNLLQK